MEKNTRNEYYVTMRNLCNKQKKINTSLLIIHNEPMSCHTSFKTGGPAEFFISPSSIKEIREIIIVYPEAFVIGEGSNLLVSDEGVKGAVICLELLKNIKEKNGLIIADAGASINDVCRFAFERGLSGFEFIYGMPGSVGGAVWMNARCYDKEIADLLHWVDYMDRSGEIYRYKYDEKDFAYKQSPFQNTDKIIISAAFKVAPGNKIKISEEMDKNYGDREKKGHFLFPCAGSVFKNNRDFGYPSGKIIENCGLKGLSLGDAQVADFHANIIINKGRAKSSEIFKLICEVERSVLRLTGFKLAKEIILAGRF